jgi:outer membrane protein OmpA-like peptidoglycan-associated protein
MNTKRTKTPLWIAALLALLVAMPAAAQEPTKSKAEGVITAIAGDAITIRDNANVDRTFSVNGDTAYKMTKGLTGVIHESAVRTSLMPGLRVKADLLSDGASTWATEVSFKAEDFRTAQQIQGGVAPTEARMDDFGSYEALAEATVRFASGSTAIDAAGKAELDALIAKAKATADYQVVLQGFTDSVGDPAANQRLSEARANAVSNYLQQSGGLMPGRVRAGDGMGIAPDAGSGSNADARKVVVKLVVDKGVHAGNQ